MRKFRCQTLLYAAALGIAACAAPAYAQGQIDASAVAALKPGQSLLEIKCADAMPLWLTEALNKNGIRRVSFSKYGTAYTTIQTRMLIEKGGVNVA